MPAATNITKPRENTAHSYHLPSKATNIGPSSSWTLAFAAFLMFLGFIAFHHQYTDTSVINTSHLHEIFINSSDNNTISTYLHNLTQHAHLAGSKQAFGTMKYVLNQFNSFGLETRITEYKVLLSYPLQSSLKVHFRDGTFENLNLGEVGQIGKVVPPYHAYSPSGTAYAKIVFVNYGREEDYRALDLMGVNVTGCIAIARSGGAFRGKVVGKAAEKGAVALLLFSDGDRFGGVERGTVMTGLGDPLSPGWAGIGGEEKLDLEDGSVKKRFPKIPSLPISAANAEIILTSLTGPLVPHEWRETLQSMVTRVGPGPTMLNFTYQGELRLTNIQNLFGIIRGKKEPDRYVLLGNHRDAWTYGAVDPNSGTSALLDIVRRYSLLMQFGWTPRRTIIFCSWDAEEFGMIGSSEWVEHNLINLGSKVVAYLNVDCAVQGPGLFARATPQLDNLLVTVTQKIKDPDLEGFSVYQTWVSANGGIQVQRLSGTDSDYAPFLHHAGIPSIDIYYGKDFPVYHTAFDTYDWMKKFGDPLFHRHVAVAGIWGLLGLHLADDSILPFNYLSYAAQLHDHMEKISRLLDGNISLNPVKSSIQLLYDAARKVVEEGKMLSILESSEGTLELKRRALNDRLMLAERGFMEAEGLIGRPWFKHLIYGPSENNGHAVNFFPGVLDALTQRSKETKIEESSVQHEIWKIARAIHRAAIALRGDIIM